MHYTDGTEALVGDIVQGRGFNLPYEMTEKRPKTTIFIDFFPNANHYYKMKTLFIVSPHSFVDVITNSSSELFILNTKKSVEAVKETIDALADVYNQRCKLVDSEVWGHNEIDKSELWTEIFSEPVVSSISFNTNKFPRASEWYDAFSREERFTGENDELTPVEQMEADMIKWQRENPQPECVEDEETEEERKAWTTYWALKSEAEDRIFADWYAHVLVLHTAMWEWVSQENGVDITPLGNLEINYGGRWAHARFATEALEKASPELTAFVEAVEDCKSWSYYVDKGDILLRSAHDNSIPYGFFNDIEAVFRCQRLHCG